MARCARAGASIDAARASARDATEPCSRPCAVANSRRVPVRFIVTALTSGRYTPSSPTRGYPMNVTLVLGPIISIIVGLMLGQSDYWNIADTGLAGYGSALTAIHGESGGHGQSEGHTDAPSHGCSDASCSPTIVTTADLLTSRALRSAVPLLANEGKRRSIILEQDPPIP